MSGLTSVSFLNPRMCCAGIRIPASSFIKQVCQKHGKAIALTSANESGTASPLCVNDFQNLWSRCELVFNGMRIPASRAGSTIVDLSTPGTFRIVRPGEQVEEFIGVLRAASLTQQ
jgi:tRNA A37 threonylcarbamoyladenosine synthetase subunit TsaC/SUA5/YrdC